MGAAEAGVQVSALWTHEAAGGLDGARRQAREDRCGHTGQAASTLGPDQGTPGSVKSPERCFQLLEGQ